MIIAVGSTNPVKVNAVKKAFARYFGEIEVVSIRVRTTVSPQPITIEETIKGAVERGYNALKMVKNATYGVGIEAGFIRVPFTITGFFDLQLCAIVDEDNRVTLGASAAFEFPLEAVEKVLKGEVKESEEVMEKIAGIKSIGDKIGAIGYLSKGFMLREDLGIQAVTSALIPRLNKELYQKVWPKVGDILKSL